ncbi:MAG: HD domain-containing protein, partial [Intestinibacter sp.]|uniref:deoxyguanosinetriphosphate triphosphohydrolase family protein n=1 Tax=Intestinibacter sp. TaxID=1965304 RepID=UPI0025B995DD
MNKKFSDVAMVDDSKWKKAIHREKELYSRENDLRSDFGRDYTRILHSLAYRRLKHKTQVFFNTHNDHICTRMEHVAHVESISYTISKALGLNSELTKAIAIGHDLGHAPFGHKVEQIIKNLTKEYLNDSFWHEKNGLRVVDKLDLLQDNKGNFANLNLTYAVRDGIVCHCGEVDENGIIPRNEAIDLNQIENPGEVQPFTWEGCIVKISDKIAYLGRDIEDALLLNIIKQKDLKELYALGKIYGQETVNTSVIIHELMNDLVKNSSIDKGICFSDDKLNFINEIKKFNYDKIYNSKKLDYYKGYSELIINSIFEELIKYYDGENTIVNLDKNLNESQGILIKEFKNWIIKYCDEDILQDCSLGGSYNNEKIYGKLD